MDHSIVKKENRMNLNYFMAGMMGLFAFLLPAQAQVHTLTLDECRQLAEEHYPAIAQMEVIEHTKSFTLANANTAWLPQVSLNAKAAYQSDVVKIPIDIPGIDIPSPDKDQYQVTADVSQLIWDGGRIAAQKEQVRANAGLEKQKLQSEVYALGERVNNVFFGILLLQEQLAQQDILDEELQRNYDKVESYIANGVANSTDLNAIKVEQLKARQQRIQMESAIDAYRKVLSVLIGRKVSADTSLAKPAPPDLPLSPGVRRPELNIFEAQELLLQSQQSLLQAKNMPVIAAFAQAGYGKPGLTLFEKKFAPLFVGGVTLSWNFGNLYTYKNEKKSIDWQKQSVAAQRKTFLYNLNTQIPLQQNEIETYRRTMQDDEEIIRLRRQIKEAAEVKVENGTMTVSDLIEEINALKAARQSMALHEIQHLAAIYQLKWTIDN
ncbi:MAG TPA: transporter [Porphyromonadaceae bacterium]|nr:transporter [Porphyromonadaceae bacterium]